MTTLAGVKCSRPISVLSAQKHRISDPSCCHTERPDPQCHKRYLCSSAQLPELIRILIPTLLPSFRTPAGTSPLKTFPATSPGYVDIAEFMATYGVITVGVEGTSSYGAGLTRHLLTQKYLSCRSAAPYP